MTGRRAVGIVSVALFACAASLAGPAFGQNVGPYGEATPDRTNALAELRRGDILYEAKDYAEAIEVYGRAIAHDPTLGPAWAGRGGARTYEGDLDGAFADFEEAIANGFAVAWTYNGRGNAYRAAGDLDRAYDDYLHAAELDPAKVDAHLNIGDVRFLRGDYRGALEAYSRAAELDPRDRTDALAAAGGRADALARLGRRAEALAAYERSLAIGGRDYVAALQRELAASGHYEGAADGVYGPATRAALEACIADTAC